MKYQYWLTVGSIIILLVTSIAVVLFKTKTRRISKWLNLELFIVFVSCVLDLITGLIFTHNIIINRYLFYVIANIYFITLLVYPIIYLKHIAECCRKSLKKIYSIPTIINVFLLLFINPFIPIYFKYDVSYNVSSLIMLLYINWMFYIIIICIIASKNKVILGYERYFTLVIGIILGIFGVVLQWILSDILITSFMLAIATIMKYIIYSYIDRSVDELTNIPTRKSFIRETEDMISKNQGPFYLVRFDICDFKMINELYGYDYGDMLLKTIAKHLLTKVGKYGTYGRLQSDNFVFCIEQKLLKLEILNDNNFYITIDNKTRLVTLYFGVYSIENGNQSVDIICDKTKLALNEIKHNSIKGYQIVDAEMERYYNERNIIEQRQELALDNDEFEFVIQPIYDGNGNLVAGEALSRWNNQGEYLSPSSYIEIFENNGFIMKLDTYIRDSVISQLRQWNDQGYELVPISINLSRRNIFDEMLINEIVGSVYDNGLTSENLSLEITESYIEEKKEEINRFIDLVRTKGFKVLMDDFGSGVSSLTSLKDMNVDILKLDMQFLDRDDNKTHKIISSIVKMAHDLDIRVIVEGVETKEQFDFLQTLQCDMYQGYYFSKPIPIDEFKQLLKK